MEEVSIKQLLEALIRSSEKAADIARTCRRERELFELLIEEKGDGKKNRRFIQDFKTLADVLVQETVRHDLSQQFPGIEDHIFGEESNQFTNTLGESITVNVVSSSEDTTALLLKVLDGNEVAANLLSEAVHKDVHQFIISPISDELDTMHLSLSSIGIWIDPIDSTNEYIHGCDEIEVNEVDIALSGLPCVCILIGIYDMDSGAPLLGVINQPFSSWSAEDEMWSGSYFWGVCCNGLNFSSVPTPLQRKHDRGVIVMSSSEDRSLVATLQTEYDIVYTSGAGYKLLCVGQGYADAYILSKGTTFRWDACAPHALLNSLGGGIVNYYKTIQTPLSSIVTALPGLQLTYNSPETETDSVDKWCNSEGFIGYRDLATLLNILKLIQDEYERD